MSLKNKKSQKVCFDPTNSKAKKSETSKYAGRQKHNSLDPSWGSTCLGPTIFLQHSERKYTHITLIYIVYLSFYEHQKAPLTDKASPEE